MDLRGANVAACFLFDTSLDELMMVSDAGQIIRIHGNGISARRRGGKGVIVFDVGDTQKVVSVARLRDEEGGDEPPLDGEEGAAPPVQQDMPEADGDSPIEEGDEAASSDPDESSL